jgi:hypothetical protein
VRPASRYAELAEASLERAGRCVAGSVQDSNIEMAHAWIQMAHLAARIGPCCEEHAPRDAT